MNRILLSVCLLFISFSSFPQSPEAIEADLLKSFKKIGYWNEDKSDGSYDQLIRSNIIFRSKLMNYTQRCSSTITQPFNALRQQRVNIHTAADGSLRIYSWDTRSGGTMRNFNNVFQYRVGDKIKAFLDTVKNDGDYVYSYQNIYTFKTLSKTYYLAVFVGVFSTADVQHGIRILNIENGKLNDVKLIKTATGLHDRLLYNYDFFSVVDWKENGQPVDWEHRPRPTFDATNQTIKLPLVNIKNQVTRKFITYKFTGKYFEKVKG